MRLIHHTVQEYLCAHPGFFSEPHSVLAETCSTYLNSQQVKNLTSHSLLDHESMPLLKYSSTYWGTHAGRGLSDHATALALELLRDCEDHVSAISLLKQVMRPSYIGEICTSMHFSGLHGASFFGIVELVTLFTNAEGCEINQQYCTGKLIHHLRGRQGMGMQEWRNYYSDEKMSTPIAPISMIEHYSDGLLSTAIKGWSDYRGRVPNRPGRTAGPWRTIVPGRVGTDGRAKHPSFIKTAVLWGDGRALQPQGTFTYRRPSKSLKRCRPLRGA